MPNASTRDPAEQEIQRAIAALQRIAEVFGERRAQLAREAGVTEAQWRMLESVERKDFLPSLFARRRACTPAAVSQTLRQLLAAGLVQVRIGEDDARQRIYEPTAKGRRVLRRLRASRSRAISAVWRPFGARRLTAFSRFAEQLADRLERYAERA